MPNLLGFLTTWYNLPFSALLIVSALMAVLQVIGLGGEAEGDADADMDATIEAEADLDGDADSDTDTDSDADGALAPLAFLGFGKAPLAIVLSILFGITGICGWLINALSALPPRLGVVGLLVTGAASLLLGALATGHIARLIGRALPPVSSTVIRQQSLVGRSGEVVSPGVDGSYGMVRVRDNAGTMITVFAISDNSTSFQKGETVMLASYDSALNRYAISRR
jgi:membrane protein implicated in regulation of membrane protease activity